MDLLDSPYMIPKGELQASLLEEQQFEVPLLVTYSTARDQLYGPQLKWGIANHQFWLKAFLERYDYGQQDIAGLPRSVLEPSVGLWMFLMEERRLRYGSITISLDMSGLQNYYTRLDFPLLYLSPKKDSIRTKHLRDISAACSDTKTTLREIFDYWEKAREIKSASGTS